MHTRREVLRSAAIAAVAPLAITGAPHAQSLSSAVRRRSVKPPRLKPGDTVGLVLPASVEWDPMNLDILIESLHALGLRAKPGKHVGARHADLAGSDEQRAEDLNAMFADPSVAAIHCIRGGWGAARLLPLLDWATIAAHPKILVGYSDITALLLSLHAKTGLVTFHGPNGSSTWNSFNLDWMKRVLWNGEPVTFANRKEPNDTLVPTRNRTRTITPGKARGRLLGGNLTVFTAIVGSPYVPDFDGAILFVEDVDEAPYRLDRMFTQLKLAGILDKVKGVVWGTCNRCDPGEGFASQTIPDVLEHHVRPLGVPAYYGAMIGHVDRQFTLPVGIEVEIDADAGTIMMLEAAVV
jgi:muramoyltetrapeptide carboxypeptidase